jgi:hypothetical protein
MTSHHIGIRGRKTKPRCQLRQRGLDWVAWRRPYFIIAAFWAFM